MCCGKRPRICVSRSREFFKIVDNFWYSHFWDQCRELNGTMTCVIHRLVFSKPFFEFDQIDPFMRVRPKPGEDAGPDRFHYFFQPLKFDLNAVGSVLAMVQTVLGTNESPWQSLLIPRPEIRVGLLLNSACEKVELLSQCTNLLSSYKKCLRFRCVVHVGMSVQKARPVKC